MKSPLCLDRYWDDLHCSPFASIPLYLSTRQAVISTLSLFSATSDPLHPILGITNVKLFMLILFFILC